MTGVDITLSQRQKRFSKGVDIPAGTAVQLMAYKIVAIKGFLIGVGKEALNEAQDNAFKLMKAWQNQ